MKLGNLLKKELFDQRQFPLGVLNEDFHLLVQLVTWLEKGIVSLPQQTYHVFYRMGSNTRKKDPDAFSRVFLTIYCTVLGLILDF